MLARRASTRGRGAALLSKGLLSIALLSIAVQQQGKRRTRAFLDVHKGIDHPRPALPATAGFKHSLRTQDVVAAAGLKSELKREGEILELLPASGISSETPGVVIIPGNPGIPHFYCDFGKQVQESYHEKNGVEPAVYILGYANFVSETARVHEVASIDDEASAFSNALSRIAARHGQGGLVLVGHSIGAWCVLRLLQQGCLDQTHLPLIVLATPYLQFDARGKQATLRSLFQRALFRPVVTLVSNFAVMLPGWMQELVAPMVGGMQTRAATDAVLGTFFRQKHHLESMVYMALTEFELLDKSRSTNGFAMLESMLPLSSRPPLLALYAEHDVWAGAEHANRVKHMFAEAASSGASPQAIVQDIGAVSHSFVLKPEESRKVADIISSHVVKARPKNDAIEHDAPRKQFALRPVAC